MPFRRAKCGRDNCDNIFRTEIHQFNEMAAKDPMNPYPEAHKDPQGQGDSRPTAIQVVKDLDLVDKLAGKVMLVTGSSSGIGIETARALRLTGADVYMHVRNVEKGEKVRQEILASTEGKGKLELVKMNMDSLQSVRDGAKDLLSHTNKLNVLVNNAGKGCIFILSCSLLINILRSPQYPRRSHRRRL